MRKLFGNKDPGLFGLISSQKAIKHLDENLRNDIEGLAFGEIESVVDQLQRRGYCLLSAKLDESKCAELEQIARESTCVLVDSLSGVQRAQYDELMPQSVRYEIQETDIVSSSVAQEIICDKSLYEVATRYLGSAPVQDLVTMWWSTSINAEASSSAAQKFHFDLDRLKFLKLFIYLTDVCEDNGPHVYIPDSHTELPFILRQDGRHEDDVVSLYFSEQVQIIGKRGLIFLADTRGLHKGMPLIKGHRLIFQFEYANCLFGYPYSLIEIENPSEVMRKTFETNQRYLERFVMK